MLITERWDGSHFFFSKPIFLDNSMDLKKLINYQLFFVINLRSWNIKIFLRRVFGKGD